MKILSYIMLFAKEYHDAISLVFQFSNSSSNFVEIPATTREVSPTLYYFSKIRLYPVYRFENSTGRYGFGLAERNPGFLGRENPGHDCPIGHVGPQFSG
jgi:hypothetical protein